MKKNKINVLLFVDFFFRILSQMSFPLFSGAVYLATGKASQLAWVSVATFLPSIILTYQSNRIIHGFSPQKTMQLALIMRILLFISFALGMKSIWAIYILIALNSAFHQLGMAAKRTLDAKCLHVHERISYNSNKVIFSNIAVIAGPLLGGILIAYLKLQTSLLIMATITFILFLVSTLMSELSLDDKVISNSGISKTSGRHSLAYLVSSGNVGFTVLSNCLIGIILGVQAPLIFPFVKEVFNKNTDAAGLLLSSAGIGGMVGAFFIKKFPKFIHSKNIPWLILLDGFIFYLFTEAKNFSISTAIFTSLGIMSAVTLVIVEGLVQDDVPEHHHPFVFSLTQFASGAGGASFGMLAGYLAEILSTKTVLSGAAIIESIIGIGLIYMGNRFHNNQKEIIL